MREQGVTRTGHWRGGVRFYGWCTCGWRGERRRSDAAAQLDLDRHNIQVAHSLGEGGGNGQTVSV